MIISLVHAKSLFKIVLGNNFFGGAKILGEALPKSTNKKNMALCIYTSQKQKETPLPDFYFLFLVLLENVYKS